MKKLVQRTTVIGLTLYVVYAGIILLSGVVPGMPGPPRLPFIDPQPLLAKAGLLSEQVEETINEARKDLETRLHEAEKKVKDEEEKLESERKRREQEAKDAAEKLKREREKLLGL